MCTVAGMSTVRVGITGVEVFPMTPTFNFGGLFINENEIVNEPANNRRQFRFGEKNWLRICELYFYNPASAITTDVKISTSFIS